VVDLPVELITEPSQEGTALVARWRGLDDQRHELTIDTTLTAAELEALLRFCYEAGFRDASNPRLFVP
jgi:hypothetical protein